MAHLLYLIQIALTVCAAGDAAFGPALDAGNIGDHSEEPDFETYLVFGRANFVEGQLQEGFLYGFFGQISAAAARKRHAKRRMLVPPDEFIKRALFTLGLKAREQFFIAQRFKGFGRCGHGG